jgi:hypothetical protein
MWYECHSHQTIELRVASFPQDVRIPGFFQQHFAGFTASCMDKVKGINYSNRFPNWLVLYFLDG